MLNIGSFSWLKADDLTKVANIAYGHPFKFLIPKEFGGGDEYNNLIIVSEKVHILIHSSNDRTIKKYLELVNPTEKELKKINQLRQLAKMSEISA